MKLEEIRILIEQKAYEAALTACDNLLEENTSGQRELLRLREYVYAMRNQFDLAICDFETIFELKEGTIDDYFQGAFRCLEAEQFSKAVDWFELVLQMGDEQNETWFKSATLFYLAFAQMELEQFDEAELRLNEGVKLEDELVLAIPHVGMCTADQMLLEIKRRKSGG